MAETVKAMWLEDIEQNKIAPKTLINQVIESDTGDTLDTILAKMPYAEADSTETIGNMTFKTGWLKDNNYIKFVPRSLTSQVFNNSGESLDEILSELGSSGGTIGTLEDLGVTATAEEINQLDGVSSNVQTQLNNLGTRVQTLEKAEPGSVETATKAEQDSEGNVIKDTYETKDDAITKFNNAKNYINNEISKIRESPIFLVSDAVQNENIIEIAGAFSNGHEKYIFYNDLGINYLKFTLNGNIVLEASTIMPFFALIAVNFSDVNNFQFIYSEFYYMKASVIENGILHLSLENYVVGNSEVLVKTNTKEYTPTENYHPATKKYVDDAISGVEGGGGSSTPIDAYTKDEIDNMVFITAEDIAEICGTDLNGNEVLY